MSYTPPTCSAAMMQPRVSAAIEQTAVRGGLLATDLTVARPPVASWCVEPQFIPTPARIVRAGVMRGRPRGAVIPLVTLPSPAGTPSDSRRFRAIGRCHTVGATTGARRPAEVGRPTRAGGATSPNDLLGRCDRCGGVRNPP